MVERKMSVYTIRFYRELVCEIDITAASPDEAEHLFREGYFTDLCRRVPNTEVVDEVVSVAECSELTKQIDLLN